MVKVFRYLTILVVATDMYSMEKLLWIFHKINRKTPV